MSEATIARLMTLADTYADGPHTDGYYGAHRANLEAALRESLDRDKPQDVDATCPERQPTTEGVKP